MTAPLYVRVADQAARLYTEHGLTSTQIARRLHISGTVVLDALHHANVPLRPAGRHGRTYLHPLDLLKAKRLYEQGLTLEQVGAELGISVTATRHRLVKAGVQFRPRGTRTKETAA